MIRRLAQGLRRVFRPAPDTGGRCGRAGDAAPDTPAEAPQLVPLSPDEALALERAAEASPAPATDWQPLVSIVMPSWNRAGVIGQALECVRRQTYAHWECLIVDDGSEDDTAAVVAPWLQDARFRYFRRPQAGVAAARNFALAQARGELVAYLDTDNTWVCTYLEWVVSAFADEPALGCAYAGQLVEREGSFRLRAVEFDAARLARANFIDVNVFSHRRVLVERCGGFDETLPRQSDWELILRYTREHPIRRLPIVGGRYRFGQPNQITGNLPAQYSRYRIRRQYRPETGRGLRILFALWHYPQASESYIRTEILAAVAAGAEVQVWTQVQGPPSTLPEDVPVHRGSFEQALAQFRPQLVHVHWLHIAESLLPAVRQAGLPMTVRAHGFEFAHERLQRLCDDPAVQRVFVYPHQAVPGEGKLSVVPAMFNGELHRPGVDKDPRLVLRLGAGLSSKDYETFFQVARLCPAHRFVLAVCRCFQAEAQVDEIVALNERLGSPAEVRVDLTNEQAADWSARAGIYLHTAHLAGPQATPLGMPISIVEAMASGCLVVARDHPVFRDYAGPAGRYYASPAQAAAHITETLQWDAGQWRRVREAAVEQAFGRHASLDLIEPVVEAWRQAAAAGAGRGVSG